MTALSGKLSRTQRSRAEAPTRTRLRHFNLLRRCLLLALPLSFAVNYQAMKRWSFSTAVRVTHSSSSLRNVPRPSSQNPYSVLATNRHVSGAIPQPQLRAETAIPTPLARCDPYKLLKPELDTLRERLLNLLGSAHPTLTDVAKYYFLQPSKQVRPLLVLLFARATNGLGSDWDVKQWAAECEGARGRTEELDQPLSRPDVLNDWNPYMPDHSASFSSVFSLLPVSTPSPAPRPPPRETSRYAPALAGALLPTQIRLAQIVEMIHVASLLHDDVVDGANLRRGAPSAPAAFGNKFTILAGDFLLGRASAALSRLGEAEVVELIASVITNLVEGEILQLNKVVAESQALAGARATGSGREGWNIYLKKTYLKTASLMAKGARASVVLGGAKNGEIWKEIAYTYGRNVGIAFQVRAGLSAALSEPLLT
jgi:hexaprenyl-diphosphate synthase